MVNVGHVEDICQLLEDSLKSPRTELTAFVSPMSLSLSQIHFT